MMIKKLIVYFLRKQKGLKVGYGTNIINSKVRLNNWLGKNVSLANASIGKYTYISDESRIRDTSIGAFCSIGRNVKIGLGFHPTNYLSTSPFLYRKSFLGLAGLSDENRFVDADYRKTSIGNDVWIGDNVLICGGCNIGDGVIIGAGSIVTKDLEPYGVYVGNPAKLIKKRIKHLLNNGENLKDWWDHNDNEIKEIIRKYNE